MAICGKWTIAPSRRRAPSRRKGTVCFRAKLAANWTFSGRTARSGFDFKDVRQTGSRGASLVRKESFRDPVQHLEDPVTAAGFRGYDARTSASVGHRCSATRVSHGRLRLQPWRRHQPEPLCSRVRPPRASSRIHTDFVPIGWRDAGTAGGPRPRNAPAVGRGETRRNPSRGCLGKIRHSDLFP